MMKRKRDSIKVLDVSPQDLAKTTTGLQCQNCKERHYFTARPGDLANLFCTNCGNLTPIRTIKHNRGLIAPVVQQQTAIVQNSNDNRVAKRRPRGVRDGKQDPLAEELTRKGFQVTDSQTIEPVR